jgi:ribosomal protein S8
MWSDPIADMLTRIRNANAAFKESVDIPLLTEEEASGYFEGGRLYRRL